jgi:hypothetical protein
MAAGDVFTVGVATANYGISVPLQPPVGAEVVIHNICHSLDASLEFFDGTNAISIDTQLGPGAWMGLFLHCTNTKYYRVVSGSAGNSISADGIQTK